MMLHVLQVWGDGARGWAGVTWAAPLPEVAEVPPVPPQTPRASRAAPTPDTAMGMVW